MNSCNKVFERKNLDNMQIVPDNIFLPRTEQVMCRLRKIKDQEAQITPKYTPVEI